MTLATSLDNPFPPCPQQHTDARTVIVLHGVLGCSRNFRSFVKRLAERTVAAEVALGGAGASARPWRFLGLDLRCHGASRHLPLTAPHTLDAAAADVLDFMRQELGYETH